MEKRFQINEIMNLRKVKEARTYTWEHKLYIHTYIYRYTYTYVYMHIYVCIYIYISHIISYIYIYIYIYIYVCNVYIPLYSCDHLKKISIKINLGLGLGLGLGDWRLTKAIAIMKLDTEQTMKLV